MVPTALLFPFSMTFPRLVWAIQMTRLTWVDLLGSLLYVLALMASRQGTLLRSCRASPLWATLVVTTCTGRLVTRLLGQSYGFLGRAWVS